MPTPNSRPIDVLVIEDEVVIAMDIEIMIEEAGQNVLGSATSVPALAELQPERVPQLAFVDMQLARGTTGLEACALLQERWPQIFVVFLTANTKKIPEDFAHAQGVIAKPFSAAGFRNAVAYLADVITNDAASQLPTGSFVPSQWFEERFS